jgi:hypothetical protein
VPARVKDCRRSISIGCSRKDGMRQKLQRAWITWSMTAIAALSLFVVDSLWRGQGTQPPIGKSQDAGNNRPADTLVHPAPGRAPGLWGVIKSLLAGVSDNRLMTEAAGITFYALLSRCSQRLPPRFPRMASLQALSGVISGGGMEIINDQIKV